MLVNLLIVYFGSLALAAVAPSVRIYVAFPLALSTYFIISTEVFYFGQYVPFGLYSVGMSDVYYTVQIQIFGFFLCWGAGVILTTKIFEAERRRKERLHGLIHAPEKRAKQAGKDSVTFAICVTPALLTVMAVGPDNLLARNTFVPDFADLPLMRFADMSYWLAACLTPYIRSTTLRGIALGATVIAFAALGSRSAPVMLFAYVLIDRYAVGRQNNVLHGLLAAGGAILLAVLLSVRDANAGGLESILAYAGIASLPEIIEYTSYGINYITNFSVTINAWMLTSGSVDWNSFFYSIVPLPSFVFGDSEAYDALNRFRVNIPYPGFGFLILNVGFLGAWLIAVAGGALTGAIRSIYARSTSDLEQVIFYAILYLPTIVSLQYNLRTTTRLFYLLLIVYCLYIWRIRRQRRSEERS